MIKRFFLHTALSLLSIALFVSLVAKSSSQTLPEISDAEQEEPWIQTNGPAGGIINAIEIDPIDPDTLYAGGAGGNVFKSTDSGMTWRALEQIVPPSWNIHDILVSPTQPQTVYTLAGLLYKSSNGGESWAPVHPDLWFSCIEMDPANPQVLVAGTGDGKVYHSTDDGNNWSEITNNLPGDHIQDIAIGSSNEFWVGTSNLRDGRLYHTTNGGLSWGEMNIGQRAETDIHTIFVDPEDTNIVYIGLVDVHNEMFDSQNDNYLLKTQDGGTTWTSLHLPGTDAMINVIGRAPTDNILYVGTGGTVYKSNDGGQIWTWIGPPGRNGDMYDIAVDPHDSDVLYLPRRAHGIVKSTDGGLTWTPINHGLLNVIISLLAVPNVFGSGTVYATASSGEGTFKTADYGNTWVSVTEGGITHPWADELVGSPHNPQIVWEVADVGEVFRTTDGGTTWDKIINPYGNGFRFGSVYAIASSLSNSNILYALKNGFGIFKSDDDGSSWQFLHQSEVDYTYSLTVHPTNPDILYSGYSPKPFQDWAMVRQTTDGGDSWRTALHLPGSSGVTSVVIDTNAPDTVYAGSAGVGGEIWVSNNGGVDWANVNEAFDFTNIHALTVDPTNPDIAYTAVWGGGTFKTTDAGQTWQRLPNDPTISTVAILVDPTNSNVIYLADRTSPRIYRTSNGGTSWEIFFDAGSGYYRILSATLAPGDSAVLYVSVFSFSGPMVGDLFRIENGVATNVTGTLPRLPVALAVDPTDANTVYAVQHGKGVYKTTNGGQTWSDISGTGSGLPQSPHIGFNGIVVDATTPNTLYLLGGSDVDVDLSHTGADPALMYTVYKSADAGDTWTNLNDGNLGTKSNAIKGLAIAPANPNVLYAGALNGVFRSIDGGNSWANINTGLSYTHTGGIALSSDGAILYAPMLGGGVYAGNVNTTNHNVTWDADSHLSANIYHVQIAVDPTDSQILYASAYPGGIFKSINGGVTWTEANFGMASFEIDDPNRQGYYALAIAPSDPNVLYLGLYGVGVYKSTDGAGTWQPMNGSTQTMRGQNITSLLIDPTNADIAYMATDNGIYYTIDGGHNWAGFSTGLDNTDIRIISRGSDSTLYAGSLGNELYWYDTPGTTWRQMNAFGQFGTLWPIWNDRPLYQYTTLLFHPTDPNIIYVGTFPAGIYKSVDGGQSWREHNVGWTNDGVFSLVFHPDNTDIIYAGTYNGVNRSTDGGEHWELWNTGWPGEQWVFSIDFDPRDPNVMYACSKNGENEGAGREDFHGTVMKSTNGGASWFPITTGLSDQEFYKIIVDKYEPDILYLATQSEGVFISQNGGDLWKSWNDGLTNLIAGTNGNNVTNTMTLTADGRNIFFGSSGSGVFRRKLDTFSGSFTYLPLVLKNGK